MKTVLINYGAGNIQSILFALERLEVRATLSDNAEEIASADRVIFPGVGEASSAMNKLKDTGLDILIPNLKQPVLGICLGMQLMCHSSAEGNTSGLGIFDTDVIRFPDTLRVPQIGWNTIMELRSPLFTGIDEGTHVYTVHSYYAPLCEDTIAVSDYGRSYSAALGKNNFFGVQFHPEKSSVAGSKILSNFLKIDL